MSLKNRRSKLPINKEELQQLIYLQENKIIEANNKHKVLNNQVWDAERQLKKLKSLKNRAYMEWVFARKELVRVKSHKSSIASQIRKRNLNNLGMVFNSMEKGGFENE